MRLFLRAVLLLATALPLIAQITGPTAFPLTNTRYGAFGGRAGWSRTAATFSFPPPPRPHDDDVLGTLEWNAKGDGRVATVRLAPHPFRILSAGERLLAHARDIFTAPEKFVGQVNDLLRKQAQEPPRLDERDPRSAPGRRRIALAG